MLGLSLIVIAALTRFPLTNALPSNLGERDACGERSTPDACGEIRNRVKAAFQANPGARPLVPAQLGYDCLTSVPLHKNEALKFIDSIAPYLEWQSNLADIKSPPADYGYAGVDVIQEVAKIRQKLNTNQYSNEYSYMLDLYKTVLSAHDALFDAKPDILYAALTFARPKNLALVSYSQDGVQLPKIYLQNEIKSPKTSAVKLINGVPASQYIDQLITASSTFPDRDAAYNSYFYSAASEALQTTNGEFQGFGPGSLIFDGPTTTLVFENGTSTTYENQARIRDNFENVTDGKSFYKRYCSGTALKYPDSTSTEVAPPRRHAYPQQITDTSEDSIAGYYLNQPGYTNIAILSVLDFSPNSVNAYQAIAQDFITRAKADKKKVVIDISSCSGGYYFLAYDLFKQFLPQFSVQDYARVRENPTFDAMTQIGSGAHFANYSAASATPDEISIAESVFNYAHFEINVNNQNFPSYEAKYGPIVHNNDKFTDIMRFNLSNPRISNPADGFGLQITGYGSRSNFKQAPFASSDIVLLTDGTCVSPCPLFASNLVQQGKVKTVAIGGRASLKPMQYSGGAAGLEAWDMGTIYDYAQTIMQFSPSKAQKKILETLTDTGLNRLLSAFVGFRDIVPASQLGSGAGKGKGANFVRAEADCRVFYTKDIVGSPAEAWKRAVDVTWGGKKCAVGK